MLVQERIFSILELLKLSYQGDKVITSRVQSYFRARKFIGSQDRNFISSCFWNIIRHRSKIRWHIKNIDIDQTIENEIILELYFLNLKYQNNIEEIKNIFLVKYKDIKKISEDELQFLVRLPFNSFFNNEMPDDIFYELPNFLLESIKRSFPDNWKSLVLSLGNEAYLDIRVNGLKEKSRNEIKLMLKDIKVETELTKFSPIGIRFLKRYPIEGHKLYKSGHIEIQGEASQIASLLLGAKPRMSVADICSGAGGKSLVLAEIMKNKGRVLAIDTNEKRLDNAGARFKRAGIHNIERKLLNKFWQVKSMAKKFDLVLIDAPCSGIGTWSRNPESRFNFTKDNLSNLIETQAKLLEKGAMMVAPGGKLAYMVCSYLPEEGIDQLEIFKKNNREFFEINLKHMWEDTILLMDGTKYPFSIEKQNHIILDPSVHKTDGFFISMFQRQR